MNWEGYFVHTGILSAFESVELISFIMSCNTKTLLV
jgi:hypothetical protein